MFSTFLSILQLAGSLGLFLFGMKLLSEALQKVAGNKLRNVLSQMTSSKLRGVTTGFLVTAFIQFSAATTVMVVSFVNAGLITLESAVPVILGANIGTTLKLWFISLLGFNFSFTSIAIPMVVLGFPMFFSKKSKLKSWGEFILGFSILLLGLDFLITSIPNIQSNPDFITFLSHLTHFGYFSIILFVFIGALITALVQSSSATMTLTFIMCYQGWLSYELAAAMVLGENIGTTITANIAAFIANNEGKKAARVHFLFNVIGNIWALVLFYPFVKLNALITEAIFHIYPYYSANDIPVSLAVFHTLFNLLNTILLINFIPQLIKMADFFISKKPAKQNLSQLSYIPDNFISTAELSLEAAKKEIVILNTTVAKMFALIPLVLLEKNEETYHELLQKLEQEEQKTDNTEQEINLFLTQIAQNDLSQSSSQLISSMLKITDNLESAADSIYHIGLAIKAKNEQKIWFTQEIRNNLFEMFGLLSRAFELMNDHLSQDYKLANIKYAQSIESEINTLRDKFQLNHLESLRNKEYSYQTGLFYSGIISQCEKVGDYIINIHEAIANGSKH